jgi:hypothetical protein
MNVLAILCVFCPILIAVTVCWFIRRWMYEIWTQGALPYSHMENNQRVWVEGYRLPCPDGCSQYIHALMLQCWSTSPQARPRFDWLASTLRGLEQAIVNQEQQATLRTTDNSLPRLDTMSTAVLYCAKQDHTATQADMDKVPETLHSDTSVNAA